MNYSFEIYDKVYDELEEAALRYNKKQTGLGLDILDDWERTLQILGSNPHGYEKKYKNFRQVKLSRFPYLIFQISKTKLQIIKFIHLKQHPQKRFIKSV